MKTGSHTWRVALLMAARFEAIEVVSQGLPDTQAHPTTSERPNRTRDIPFLH